MNIFERRPLSLILCIMLGGFSLFINFSAAFKILVIASLVVIFVATFIFDNKIRGSKAFLRFFTLILFVAVLLSLCWSLLYFPTRHYDATVNLRAKVYDIDNSSYNVKIILSSEEISGKKDKHKLILYTDRDTAQNLHKYDIVEVTATLRAFKDDSENSGKGYYVSRGISAYLENAEQVTVVDNKVDKFDLLMSNIRLRLSNTLKKRTNFQTGAFLSALIIGEREDLDGNTRLNFSRIGISHVLALSGMHLAILSIALTKLLTLFKVSKKPRTILIIVFTFLYMLLTGFSPSVFRSGIMLIITGVLYLLSRTSDSMTSLFIAVTVILLCTPYAVYDISLWLSAFATLGVIVFAEFKKEISKEAADSTRYPRLTKLLASLKNGLLVSLFAFGATFAISSTRFSAFSVLSIVTTLIFSVFIELLIYSGLLVLALGWLIPIGKPIVVLSDFTKELAEALSDARWAYVSGESIIIKLLIVAFSVFFFMFMIFKTDKKKTCIIILTALLLTVFGIAEIDSAIVRHTDGAIYVPNSSGDIFILKSEGNISVVYSGKEYTSSGYEISDALRSQKITYVDRLIFANYSYTTSSFCEELIGACKTSIIYAPTPSTKDEINQAEGLSDMLELWGAELRFYNLLERMELDEYSVCFFDRQPYKYGEYPMNVFSVNIEGQSYTYITSGNYDFVNADSKALLYNSENLFIGTGGNVKFYKFDMILPKIKTINYAEDGRLTKDALEYYASSGAEINLIESEKYIK